MTQDATSNRGFGIDIGGSGIKGAIVDFATGEFVGERLKIATPQPATPEKVAEVVRTLVEKFEWKGPVGITLPSVIKHQHARSAANIDASWIGTNVQALFQEALERTEVMVLNDADAAGLAEVKYGATSARTGTVLFLTLGTGIGSAFLNNGVLFPNTEIGHLYVDGKEAEHQAAASVKKNNDLSYKQWAKRLSKVLREYEALFSPDLFLIGGGISRKAEKWVPLLDVETPVEPAMLLNRAGIVGAALAAREGIEP